MALSYHSVKLIKVENTILALIYYTLAAGIMTYVVYFSLYHMKGYQEIDVLTASTMIKVKGSAYTLPAGYNQSLTPDVSEEDVLTVFDDKDLVVPPMLPDSVFVTTNFIFTPNQTRGICSGNDDKMERCNCTKAMQNLTNVDFSNPTTDDWDRIVKKCCKAGRHTNNGITTGDCAGDSDDGSVHGEYCAIKAWCPLEIANPSKAQMKLNELHGVEDWTVFIRTNVKFPNFGITLSNADGTDHTMGKDLFTLSYVVQQILGNLEQVKQKGAIILVTFEFKCDFDNGHDCDPIIRFTRLDNASSAALSTGFNYRDVTRYRVNGVETRDVHKYFGIHLLVQVFGQGGRFAVFPLFITLGSGAALLGVSTVICDIIMQYFAPAREKYVDSKYQRVPDDEPININKKRRSIDQTSDDDHTNGGGGNGYDDEQKDNDNGGSDSHSVVIRRAGRGNTVLDDDKPYEPLSPTNKANDSEYTSEHSRLLH